MPKLNLRQPERQRVIVSFVAPIERLPEIQATFPDLKKNLGTMRPVAQMGLRIRNPVYVPSQAEIHLVIEFAKNVVSVAGVAIQTWKFLKKRFRWLKKPKARARTRKKPRRR